MHANISVFQVLFLLVVLSSAAPRNTKDSETCKKLLHEVDMVTKNLLFMVGEPLVPSNSSSMDNFCKMTLPLSKKASRYARCERGLNRQIASIFASAIKKPSNFICKTRQQESMDSYECFTPKFTRKLKSQAKNFSWSIHQMAENTQVDSIIPTFCCSSISFLGALNSLDAPKCKRSSINARSFYHARVSSALGDLTDLLCGTYKTLSQCKDKVPKTMEILENGAPSDFDASKSPFVANILKAASKITI